MVPVRNQMFFGGGGGLVGRWVVVARGRGCGAASEVRYEYPKLPTLHLLLSSVTILSSRYSVQKVFACVCVVQCGVA